MDDLSPFCLVLGTICPNSIFDDLSQFYFGRFVTSHIHPRLDTMSQKRSGMYQNLVLLNDLSSFDF